MHADLHDAHLGDDRDADSRSSTCARSPPRRTDAETRLAGFVMGTNDLAKETRARLVPGRAPMLPWLIDLRARRARIRHRHSRRRLQRHRRCAKASRAECAQARDLGFDGKTLIHPNQIEPCNAAFSPTPDEVAQARKMIAAFDLPENRDKGVVQIDGRMVERMHAEMARRTVAIAEAIAARGVACVMAMPNPKARPCDEAAIRAARARIAAAPQSSKPWVLAVTIMASTISYIDESVVNVALPTIEADLKTSAAVVQWLVNAYMLSLTALVLIGGAAGDQFGRRRVFVAGTALFAAASLWCGLSGRHRATDRWRAPCKARAPRC